MRLVISNFLIGSMLLQALCACCSHTCPGESHIANVSDLLAADGIGILSGEHPESCPCDCHLGLPQDPPFVRPNTVATELRTEWATSSTVDFVDQAGFACHSAHGATNADTPTASLPPKLFILHQSLLI
jgi:hypothetical protein